MANAWLDQGQDVWLVSTYLGAHLAAYPLHPRVSQVSLSQAISDRGTRLWPVTLRKARALRRLLMMIRPDVVISFLTNVNVLTILARAHCGIPVIISERTDPLHDCELPRALRVARTLCYRFADALVVQSSAVAEHYRARLRGMPRTTVIHNPLPAELAASPRRAQQQGEGGCVVAMGRLTREKGYSKLIEAFAHALRDDRAWRLRIWGEGPLRDELQSQVERLQLTERVQLCGLTDQPWTALAAGQIFALSSEYEGFPNAMLEAMALGLPCIAFDCPSGPRELADGGLAARLVPCGDVASLAAALGEFARDPELRSTLGARAAAFVRNQFAQPFVMAEWDALMEQVISQPAGAAAQHLRSSAPTALRRR
jgi:glycosyltransferase involved in cell wall biosynthesis